MGVRSGVGKGDSNHNALYACKKLSANLIIKK